MAHEARLTKIAPGAYDALVEALSAIFWNRAPFERFVRLTLRDHPELLARLTFGGLKREVAADLVMELATNEPRYRDVTLDLMLEVSAMDQFPNLNQQADKTELQTRARDAVAHLRSWTTQYGEARRERDRMEAERQINEARAEQRRSVERVLAELLVQYLTLHDEADHQARGHQLESLLNELFFLYDLNPRRSFRLRDEQIDGAFTFSTDDYILEAKWEQARTSREAVDVLAQKVHRKSKNTLGLFVSIAGFGDAAVRAHSDVGTGLIFVDGTDLYMVLEGRIPLTDVLEAKRRHLSETGSPLLLVRDIVG